MSAIRHLLAHHIIRIAIIVCVICSLLMLFAPTAGATDEPSLEFNQSTYELNDTVQVNLANVPTQENVLYLNINSTSDILKLATGEKITGSTNYTLKNPVADRNNDGKITNTDMDIKPAFESYNIQNISFQSDNTFSVDIAPPSIPSYLSLDYTNGHTVRLNQSSEGNYIGKIEITNNSSQKRKLYASIGDEIQVKYFHGDNLDKVSIARAHVTKTTSENENTSQTDNNQTNSTPTPTPTPTPAPAPTPTPTPTPAPTPTPTETPSATDSDTGDTTPPTIGTPIAYYRSDDHGGSPELNVYAAVSEPIRPVENSPDGSPVAQLSNDGDIIGSTIIEDGSAGKALHLRAAHPPNESLQLHVEPIMDRSGNSIAAQKDDVRMAVTAGSTSDETLRYIPGEPLALVADAVALRRITATKATGWLLADRVANGSVQLLATDDWPRDAPVTLQVDTASRTHQIQAEPVSPRFEIGSAQVDGPRGPIRVEIEGPPTVRRLQVSLRDAEGELIDRAAHWSSPDGRTTMRLPIATEAEGPLTVTVTDPQSVEPPSETVVALPADGRAISEIVTPESLERGAMLPITLHIDPGAEAGIKVHADDTPLLRVTLTDEDDDGTISAHLNTHAMITDTADDSGLLVEATGGDVAQTERLQGIDSLQELRITGVDTSREAETVLFEPDPELILERAPAEGAAPFSETDMMVTGERLRLRIDSPALAGLRHLHTATVGDQVMASLPPVHTPRVHAHTRTGVTELEVMPRWSDDGATAVIDIPPSATSINASLPSVTQSIDVTDPAILQVDPVVVNLAPMTTVEVHTATQTHRTQVAADGSVVVSDAAAPERISVPGTEVDLVVATADTPSTDRASVPQPDALMKALQTRLIGNIPSTLSMATPPMQLLRYAVAALTVVAVIWAGHRLRRQRNA